MRLYECVKLPSFDSFLSALPFARFTVIVCPHFSLTSGLFVPLAIAIAGYSINLPNVVLAWPVWRNFRVFTAVDHNQGICPACFPVLQSADYCGNRPKAGRRRRGGGARKEHRARLELPLIAHWTAANDAA